LSGGGRSGIVALLVLFGAAVAAVPAVADGGPLGFDPAYYPSIWRGAYAGLHAGYGWSGDANGFVGGGQVGYNWQSQQFVYGIEADISLSNIGVDETVVTPFGVARASAEIDWLATIRGRAGVLVQPRLLVYGTAGLAIVSASGKASASVPGLPTISVSDRETETGFVYGLGVESKWTDTTSVRVEYLGFGDTSAVDSFGIIRVGVNFKFGQ
jgi:outer membrane immunogenic protein